MSLISMCIWAVVSMALSPLPVKYQVPPGLVLLSILPVLLVWLARDYGVWPVVFCTAGAASLFRNPLREGFQACAARFKKD